MTIDRDSTIKLDAADLLFDFGVARESDARARARARNTLTKRKIDLTSTE